MAVLSRKVFGSIELLRVDTNPNGVIAPVGSLAVLTTNGASYKTTDGAGTWQLVTQNSPLMAPSSIISVAGSGPQGSQGVVGSQGAQGQQGYQGTQGVQGSKGSQGSQGPQGTNSSQGAQGDSGAQGSQGSAGAQGSQGTTGSSGTVGSVGSQGPQGTQGSQGSQGGPGSQGLQGPQGSQGSQGAAGNGSQGTQGLQGFQGSQGLQGAASLVAGPGGASGSTTSGLILVQTQTVTGSAVQTVTFSGLDGNTHKAYLLVYRLFNSVASGTSTVTLRPNGLTTNQTFSSRYSISSTTSNLNTANLNGPGLGNNGEAFGTVEIMAESSKPRYFMFSITGYHPTSATVFGADSCQRWNESSTNLTSLEIYGAVGGSANSCIGVGSVFHLYRYEV